MDSSLENLINSNHVSNNNKSDGMYLFNSDRNKMTYNTVSHNNGTGIFLKYSDENHLINNIVQYNDHSSGIVLHLSNSNEIAYNEISSNKRYGIELIYSLLNEIYENTFRNNEEDCIYDTNSKWNMFYDNKCNPSYKLTKIFTDFIIIILVVMIIGLIFGGTFFSWKNKKREND